MSEDTRICEAPTCGRRAEFIAKGYDSLGKEHFEDAVCPSCLGYLQECAGAFNDPLEVTRL